MRRALSALYLFQRDKQYLVVAARCRSWTSTRAA
jgi:hypothetical protein